MKKALIIVSVCLAIAIAIIVYLVTGNEGGPNEDIIRAEERIIRLEEDLKGQRLETFKAQDKVTELKKDLDSTRSQKPIIEKIYYEERNRIRNLDPDESVKYLAAWLSEVDNN